eukprot:g460.t1
MDMSIELEDVNDMLIDLGLKEIRPTANPSRKMGFFKGLARKLQREIHFLEKKCGQDPTPFKKDLRDIDSYAERLGLLQIVPETKKANPISLIGFLASEVQSLRLRLMRENFSSKRRETSTPLADCTSASNQTKTATTATATNDENICLLDRSDFAPKELRTLAELNKALRRDYTFRRDMLIQRMDVTIDACMLSPLIVGREAEVLACVSKGRKAMTKSPSKQILVDSVFFPQSNLLKVTCSAVNVEKHRSGSSVRKLVTVRDAPDRGGRPDQVRPSAKDMMRHAFGNGGRHRQGGGRGRGRRSGGGANSNDKPGWRRPGRAGGRGGGSEGQKTKKKKKRASSGGGH